MRAGRTGIIVLGIVVSALAVFGPEVILDLERTIFIMATIGIGLVFMSTVLALGTYTITEYPSGIGTNHRRSAIEDGYDSSEWLVFMLEEYGHWTEEINGEIEANAEHLENTVLLQLLGLICITFAIMLGYMNRVNEIPPRAVFITLFLLAIAVVVIGLVLVAIRKIASSLKSKRT